MSPIASRRQWHSEGQVDTGDRVQAVRVAKSISTRTTAAMQNTERACVQLHDPVGQPRNGNTRSALVSENMLDSERGLTSNGNPAYR